jgi:hypothetical protein
MKKHFHSVPWGDWNISHQESTHGDLKPYDTAGMLCTCGKRLLHKGIENGCHILACPDPKCIRQYQIPIDNRQDLEYPGELVLRGWKPPIVPPDAVLMKPELALKSLISTNENKISTQVEKKYTCLGRDCGCKITQEQAERTYREHEKALCVVCERKNT